MIGLIVGYVDPGSGLLAFQFLVAVVAIKLIRR